MEKSDSDIPRVDLYRKTMVFDEKNKKKYKKVKISKKLFEQGPSGGESTPLIPNLTTKIVIYRVLTTPPAPRYTPRDTPTAA